MFFTVLFPAIVQLAVMSTRCLRCTRGRRHVVFPAAERVREREKYHLERQQEKVRQHEQSRIEREMKSQHMVEVCAPPLSSPFSVVAT